MLFDNLNYKIGDIVRIKALYPSNSIHLSYDELLDREIGKCFKIIDIDPSYDYPYELEGSRWLRRDEELELVN